ATRRESHWFTTSRSDLEKRRVCVSVSRSVSVCRCNEYDRVALGRPNRIEVFAGVGDATSETAFAHELRSGQQIFCLRVWLCRLDKHVRLCVFDPLVPVANRKLFVNTHAILLRLSFRGDLLIRVVISRAGIDSANEQNRSAIW